MASVAYALRAVTRVAFLIIDFPFLLIRLVLYLLAAVLISREDGEQARLGPRVGLPASLLQLRLSDPGPPQHALVLHVVGMQHLHLGAWRQRGVGKE